MSAESSRKHSASCIKPTSTATTYGKLLIRDTYVVSYVPEISTRVTENVRSENVLRLVLIPHQHYSRALPPALPRRRGWRRAMGGHAPPLGALLSRAHVAEDDAVPPLRPAHAALLARALHDAALSHDWPRAAGACGWALRREGEQQLTALCMCTSSACSAVVARPACAAGAAEQADSVPLQPLGAGRAAACAAGARAQRSAPPLCRVH